MKYENIRSWAIQIDKSQIPNSKSKIISKSKT
jgi:hypothetical protein